MNELTPRPGNQAGALSPGQAEQNRAVADVMARAVESFPRSISYDPAEEQYALLHVRMQTDPGILASSRDGWRGRIVQWWIGCYDVPDERTREAVTLPSVCLLADDDQLVRLSGWPAVTSWVSILRAVGEEIAAVGIPVKVVRRQSGTAGRSYWQILIDTAAPK